MRLLASLLPLALLSGAALGQQLMVCESTNDRVMLFDATDGSLITDTFIDLTTVGASTPIEAQVVNGEIWVTDQVADSIFRFSLDGTTHLGTIDGTVVGLDNIRGGADANGQFYVSNSGTGNGAPGDALVVFDYSGALVTSFPVGDPFDVVDFNGSLLVCNIAGDDLDVYAYDGTFLSTLHDSDGTTGIDFPEQATLRANGNILVGGFTDPDGIYEFDPSGVQLNFWDMFIIAGQGGIRGAQELGNGNILYTNGNGVHVFDPVGMTSTTILASVSARFVGLLGTLEPGSAYCFGDGTGSQCPCGNQGGAGEGCANSTGPGGVLSASGSASVAAADLVLQGSQLAPGQPGLYFQGDNAIAGGAGVPFGDGLRCAGGGVIRIQVRTADSSGASQTTTDIVAKTGVNAGDVKRYQLWYRDPNGTPCGTGFNLTNGYEITWTP